MFFEVLAHKEVIHYKQGEGIACIDLQCIVLILFCTFLYGPYYHS